MQGDADLQKLTDLAQQLRRDTIRMIHHAGSGHIGGALGLADYMAALYGWAMQYDDLDPTDPDRDRIVLSNGHTCAVWYAALARSGLIPLEELATHRRMGSRLQGHPARKAMPDYIETSTGPLGQGFPVANGIALSLRKRDSQGRVYVILGDGELQEGQVWEAFMTSAHYKLDNVCVFINYNNIQIDGNVEDVMGISPLADKIKAFGWHVVEIDGHDIGASVTALSEAASTKGKPTAIIGNTIMAKGVPFMEGDAKWHGNTPSGVETTKALESVGTNNRFNDFPIANRA
ncbi:MAG: transketolase [Spirochaetae bacterium HGW-Spirochaetae-2]|jgi:transketolase|nr:MAG: transketolase [Spirochaetae bacterium HGW-Spirochaetae-2]